MHHRPNTAQTLHPENQAKWEEHPEGPAFVNSIPKWESNLFGLIST